MKNISYIPLNGNGGGGANPAPRNYQLDVLKLVFTLFVFVSHTFIFIGENTRFKPPYGLGWVSVHFFFIVSGLLMVNSYMKREDSLPACGKRSMQFVLRKFKGIALPYYVSILLFILLYFLIKERNNPIRTIIQDIPQLLGVRQVGLFYSDFNGVTWYISAMLLCMLPLHYLLSRNKNFFLYVFSPLAILILFSYASSLEKPMLHHMQFYGFISGSLLRGVLGICSGAAAWTISSKLREMVQTKPQKILATAAEVVLYLFFFVIILIPGQNYKTLFSVMLILPIPIAITFSGVSYVAMLFQWDKLRCLEPLSLMIYFNHYIARIVVEACLPGRSYKFSVAVMFGLTILVCALYFVIIKLLRLLWNKKLKPVFSNSETPA